MTVGNSVRKSACIALFCLSLCLCALAAQPGLAAPPDTLTLQDLVNRPDRWPLVVTVSRDLAGSSGLRVQQGQAARVIGVTTNGVQADTGGGRFAQLTFDQCNLLDAANQAWAALTPAQRAIDPAALARDVTLWPTRVQAVAALSLSNGKSVPPGTELGLVDVEGDQVKLLDEADRAMYTVPEGFTDVFPRARALALTDPAKRPSRVADALRNILVGADGLPHQSRTIDDSQIFVLYYGASWCPPCRQFTPGFVEYIRHAEAGNPRMSVVMISDDKDEAKMREYMTEENMPFPAVPFAAWTKSPLLSSYLRKSIPALVILDRNGKVLAENYAGDQYLDPRTTVQALSQMLASGAAR